MNTLAEYTERHIDKFDEVRAEWEEGSEVLSVIKQLDDMRVLVIARRPDTGQYLLYRYFLLGTVGNEQWACSADGGQGVELENVWGWLEDPGAIPQGDY
tara:strand:+ start:751 stop:1047 length:297 start_codon:yes stop_codon:yes gene_type:complete